jgi:hypothetical protein
MQRQILPTEISNELLTEQTIGNRKISGSANKGEKLKG